MPLPSLFQSVSGGELQGMEPLIGIVAGTCWNVFEQVSDPRFWATATAAAAGFAVCWLLRALLQPQPRAHTHGASADDRGRAVASSDDADTRSARPPGRAVGSSVAGQPAVPLQAAQVGL